MGVKVLIWVVVIVGMVMSGALFFFWGQDQFSTGEEDVAVEFNKSLYNSSIDVEENKEEVDIGKYAVENAKIFRSMEFSLNSTSESIVLARPKNLLNLNENISSVFRRYVYDEDFPVFLNGSSTKNMNYEYIMRISNNFRLKEFMDNDYMDGNRSIGFTFPSDSLILDYVIDFKKKILWKDFVGEDVMIFGIPYKVVSSDYDSKKIVFLEYPYSFYLAEGEVVSVSPSFYGGMNLFIYFINEDTITLEVDGVKIKSLNEGGVYNGDGFSVFIEEILYSTKEGKSSVGLIISPGKVILDNKYLIYDSEDVGGIDVFIEDDEYLERIEFSWYSEEDMFFTPESDYNKFSVPFFKGLTFSMLDYRRDDENKKYWNVSLCAVSYEVVSD